jgi:hypothetical protein
MKHIKRYRQLNEDSEFIYDFFYLEDQHMMDDGTGDENEYSTGYVGWKRHVIVWESYYLDDIGYDIEIADDDDFNDKIIADDYDLIKKMIEDNLNGEWKNPCTDEYREGYLERYNKLKQAHEFNL